MPGYVNTLPVADKRVDFTYDLASQPVALTRYADLSGNQLVAATDYLFDQAARLTGMTHSKGASIFADYDWTFDEANRMTRFESLIDGVGGLYQRRHRAVDRRRVHRWGRSPDRAPGRAVCLRRERQPSQQRLHSRPEQSIAQRRNPHLHV
jgi:hypothetical protein